MSVENQLRVLATAFPADVFSPLKPGEDNYLATRAAAQWARALAPTFVAAADELAALRAERDALLSEVTDLRVEAAGVDRLTRETDEVAAAIGGTDYMDPPDGGAPSLGEQVSRMRADRDALRARVSELEAAGRAVLNCNDQVCAFGHGGCPAQCRADEMLRKAIRCAGNKGDSRDG